MLTTKEGANSMLGQTFHSTQRFIFVACFLLVSGLLLQGCEDGKHKPLIKAPPEKASSGVTYETIRPILEQRCSSCHPEKSPPQWTDYDQALEYVNNGKLLQRVVQTQTMPPAGSPEAQAMTEDERAKIAQWVASGGILSEGDPAPKPSPTPSQPSQPQGPWQVASQCTSCHGDYGVSSTPGIPHLAGQNPEYLVLQLQNFKSEARQDLFSQSMTGIAENLTEEQINFLAQAFGNLDLNIDKNIDSATEEVKALYNKGEELATMHCNFCHVDENNKATSPDWPNLAGQDKDYLINQLKGFLNGERPSDLMVPTLEAIDPALTDKDIEALATYFSYLKP